MLKKHTLSLCAAILLVGVSNAPADVVDLTSNALVGGAFESDDTQSIAIGRGVTLTVDTISVLMGTTGSEFSATNSGAGVDTLGVSSNGGDGTSALDNGETLTFTFTFPQPTIDLVEFDFANQTGDIDAGDRIFLNVAGTDFELAVGVSGYSGGSDTFTPSTPLTISSGEGFTLTAEDSYTFTSFEFTAIPEPATVGILAIAMLGLGSKRRRRS